MSHTVSATSDNIAARCVTAGQVLVDGLDDGRVRLVRAAPATEAAGKKATQRVTGPRLAPMSHSNAALLEPSSE